MMDELTYNTLSDRLVESVPELEELYRRELEWWGDEVAGPYNIFGDVLLPFLFQLLKECGKEETLQRIFAFLETMASHPDRHIRDVVQIGVCEQISGQSEELLREARKYMGENTRQLSHEIAVRWGHEPPCEDDPPHIKAMAPPS